MALMLPQAVTGPLKTLSTLTDLDLEAFSSGAGHTGQCTFPLSSGAESHPMDTDAGELSLKPCLCVICPA